MKTWEYFTACIVLPAWAGMTMGATLHVSPGRGGGYTSIQAAIDAAVSGHDKIEVGRGTYYEAIDFHGKAVRLYSKHGPAATIIDGTGNFHVVRCTSGESRGTILEGFTITGGNAGGVAIEDAWGGGMYNSGTSPTVMNCVFTGNAAGWGGGMFNMGGSPRLTNCVFRDNSAGRGGGIFDDIGSNAIVTNCTFHNNQADDGGGICNGLIGRATVTDCTFTNNGARFGGGIASIQGSGDANGCTFLDNTADEGGAVYYGDSAGIVSNCTFHHNVAGAGGAMANAVSDVLVTNCIFTANAAAGQGGGISNIAADLIATHCTFSGNTAEISAGAIMSLGIGSTTTVTNCVLWADLGGEIDTGFATLVVTYSDIQGGWADAGNIDTDPLFVGVAGDLHLAPDSPCVDAGTNDPAGGLPGTDIEGNRRPVDGNGDGVAVADMGAYELSPKVKKIKR